LDSNNLVGCAAERRRVTDRPLGRGRSLQLTTPLVRVFDPGAGVGVGLNVCAKFLGCAWAPALVLGWALTRPFWRALGASAPQGAVVPISVTLDTGGRHRRRRYAGGATPGSED